MDDKEVARQLQKQFDKEAAEKRRQVLKDEQMAASLAHQMSDSESSYDSDSTIDPNDDPRCEDLQDKTKEDPVLALKTARKRDSSHFISDEEEEEDEACSSSSKKSRTLYKDDEGEKPVCKYGSKCYRRNPSHLAEFSHDTDANSSSSSQKTSSKSATKKAGNHYGFYLTSVRGIDREFNSGKAFNFTQYLKAAGSRLKQSAQFNYCIDIDWLVEQYPPEFRDLPLLVIHGAQRGEKAELEKHAKSYPNLSLCQAKLEIAYGTHHTKMMLLLYEAGLRVIIHTANLRENDWDQKTQGVWVSPVFPPLGEESETKGESETGFKRDLLQYLVAYRAAPLDPWRKIIREHNLSAAKVYIIGSVPGRHVSGGKTRWGHMKLRKVLSESGPDSKLVQGWPLIGQFSSLGSLGSSADSWVASEWKTSLMSTKGPSQMNMNNGKIKLIFPTKDNVRLSLEGYAAGGAVPYSIKTAQKQQWLNGFLHQWKAEHNGRTRACPHIKTYFRVSPNNKDLAWFLVTSANMSKAAWGCLEKGGIQLMIRSYELGVLFLPKHFDQGESFSVEKDAKEGATEIKHAFPLPYDVPVTPYDSKDRPWIWDIPYVDKPDTHGTKWCPPLK